MAAKDLNDLYIIAREGCQEDTEELFRYLSVRFHLFVRRRVRNKQDCEEIVQDALMVIGREFKLVEINVSFAAWAYKVLQNRVLAYFKSFRREASRRSEYKDTEEIHSETLFKPDPDLRRRVLYCLQKIGGNNVRFARIINLHYQGYSTEEICEKLEMTRSNFYTMLFRARSLMEECIGKGELKR